MLSSASPGATYWDPVTGRYVEIYPAPPAPVREYVFDYYVARDSATRLKGSINSMHTLVSGYGLNHYQLLRGELYDMERAVDRLIWTIDRREGYTAIRGEFSNVEGNAARTDDRMRRLTDPRYPIVQAWYGVLDSLEDTRRVIR